MKHNNTMQYRLLEESLKEKNLFSTNIRIDHKTGLNYVNNVELSIKYPLSIIEEIKLLDVTKKYTYCFKGQLTDKNSKIDRSLLLSPFENKNSIIEGTDFGRKRENKNKADLGYFQMISNSKFSLCPNWNGEWYNHDYGWTYRLIESCFAKSIPIAFKQTPYGKKFIRDIKFLWSDENHDVDEIEYDHIISFNYKTAITYWTLQPDEIEKIKNGL